MICLMMGLYRDNSYSSSTLFAFLCLILGLVTRSPAVCSRGSQYVFEACEPPSYPHLDNFGTEVYQVVDCLLLGQ